MRPFHENRLKETPLVAGSKEQFNLWWTLLETALQTPSPHNVQPWRIRLVSEREAELYIDGNRTLPKEDVTGSFILSAMGMFIEAIALLAAPRGVSLEYELSHPPQWYTDTILHDNRSDLLPFARLQLSSGSPQESPYPESLFLKRSTSRINFWPTPIGETASTDFDRVSHSLGTAVRTDHRPGTN